MSSPPAPPGAEGALLPPASGSAAERSPSRSDGEEPPADEGEQQERQVGQTPRGSFAQISAEDGTVGPADEAAEAQLKMSMVAHVPSLLLRRHNHQNQVTGFQRHGGCCRRMISSMERWYVRSWWAQFLCGVATIVMMLIDPVLDYCAVYLYIRHGHIVWGTVGIIFILFSPLLSLWLHLRASRADLVKPHKRIWLKMAVVPIYEAIVGWRAVRFMWLVRHNKDMYPAIEVAMAEVTILAGQEALFESLPQLVLQFCAYLRDYYGTATAMQNSLFLFSLGTSVCVVTSRIVCTLLFVSDGGLAAFAFLTQHSTRDMHDVFSSASEFMAAKEAAQFSGQRKHNVSFGADVWLTIEQQLHSSEMRSASSPSLARTRKDTPTPSQGSKAQSPSSGGGADAAELAAAVDSRSSSQSPPVRRGGPDQPALIGAARTAIAEAAAAGRAGLGRSGRSPGDFRRMLADGPEDGEEVEHEAPAGPPADATAEQARLRPASV
eukprot:TRINITY_DN29669_c0_g1_i1.p1 TRINITY_DN29669_c0_g1~~TRINITY_DN29669_c0_g1_i1.p1  ORF type:complete len:492 (+),score=99.80 TRINITY_DN29669_c0_g1_i1:82-1557(+)